MRRRLATILSTALLSSVLLLPATAATALAETTAVVLATEGGEVTGPTGRTADDPDNVDFAPATYEGNWSWRVGKVLLTVFLIVTVYFSLMYYLRVSRPARSNRS